ncbi:DNA translocase FtsK [Methylocystis bryophila]|uniref:DNA translocase FtsK n=1 Tax=Methylocystis bryophila TaxID=655015 RepID=A0A1W6MSJ9_9HYPH|nr:DNA translocase FtsK [Methylocystis bryophila]ARN80593.1 cell division protein FtsK [Methylocystis bryophila]BDV40645.1 DNA translocase FtsK [Methylocystis bryophila]
MTRGQTIAPVPESLRDTARKRVIELAGLLLLLLCGALALALATWSTRDPSINHATDSPVRNWLGSPGAIVADLIMQTIGVGAAPALLPLAGFGLRLIGRRRFDRPLWRAVLWLLGVCCAATAAALLPVTDRWPLPTGLGGVLGDTLFSLGRRSVGGGPLGAAVVGLVAVLGAILCLTGAAGMGFNGARESADDAVSRARGARQSEEYDEEDVAGEPSAALVWLGALLHYAMTAHAGIKGLFAERKARSAARETRVEQPIPPFSDSKREPTFDYPANAPDISPGEPRAKSSRSVTPFVSRPRDSEPAPSRPSASSARKPRYTAEVREQSYASPSLELLTEPKKPSGAAKLSPQALVDNAQELERVLEDFTVRGEIVNVHPGPVVTLYELEPAPGVKSSRVISLADDIARSMSAISARVAVVPGRNAIGIELPNQHREMVYLRELLACPEFTETKHKLAIALGKTIGGEPVVVDLARMPHLLVAGTTGSGKSVAINTMILSLLYRLKPQECRLILVDPKMLELSVYDNVPHLLTPVVTDPKKAVVALKWAVREMEDRYKKMSKVGVRNIDGFNARVLEARASGEVITRTVQAGFDPETGEAIYETEEMDLAPLPYIVVIVDEMADLMLVAGKDIEGAIQRLAQMARAAGIHLIMATQRPSVDVITGTIKANFPTRISFQVTSKIDSRTILSEMGAEQLLGQGDMLYMAGGGRISRVHGPFVSDAEVEKVVAYLRTQGQPSYLDAIVSEEESTDDGESSAPGSMSAEEGGNLYDRAVAIVLRDKKCSTSYIQRRLSVGYNKAASLVEQMEKEGLVSPPNHAGKREILVGGGVDRGAFDVEAAE